MPEQSEGYFSKFGGLWIDHSNFPEELQRKLVAGELNRQEADDLRFYEANGYIIFKGAVAPEVCDAYTEAFDKIWTDPPPVLWASEGGRIVPFNPKHYDHIVKVADFHYYYGKSAQIIFPDQVKRFLELIYERPPVVFQTMTVRKGTQEPLHTDTGPLTLTEPMSLAASWLALEDVVTGSGELQFVPKSHRVPEKLVNGKTKAHNGDMEAYGRSLDAIIDECRQRNYGVEGFMAKKGDVLIWAADLMHGGEAIENPDLTRKSLICHFMPLGVMPTFYDSSSVNCLDYGNSTYYLDRFNAKDIEYYARPVKERSGFAVRRMLNRTRQKAKSLLASVVRK